MFFIVSDFIKLTRQSRTFNATDCTTQLTMPNAMPNIQQFDTHGETQSLAIRWPKWISQFKSAMVGFDIDNNARKRALLLYYGGPELHDLFDGLAYTGEDDDFDTSCRGATSHTTAVQNWRTSRSTPGTDLHRNSIIFCSIRMLIFNFCLLL